MTRDSDLVIALDAAQSGLLISALGAQYHADPVAIATAIREARPWNIIHLPSVVKIDLVPRKETRFRRAEFERRSRVDLAGVPLWIVSVEDLILSKLEWSRESRSEQQQRDVKLLLQAPLHRVYLDHWATQLDLYGLLQEADNERHQP